MVHGLGQNKGMEIELKLSFVRTKLKAHVRMSKKYSEYLYNTYTFPIQILVDPVRNPVSL